MYTVMKTILLAILLAPLAELHAADTPKPAAAGQSSSFVFTQSRTREEWIVKFDSFNAALNNGKGWSESSDSATLGWNESYLLNAYLNMYQATHAARYLDSFVSHIEQMIGPNGTWFDVAIASKKFKGWTTTRYAADKKPYPYLVHDGMLSVPMARFVRMAHAGETPPEYAEAANRCLVALEQHLIAKWETCWREISGANPPGAIYVNPADGSFKDSDAGRSLPYNQFLTMAETFAHLSRTKDYPLAADYGKRAARLLQAFKQGWALYDAGKWQALCWHYWDPKLPTDSAGRVSVEDTSHGNLDVSAVVTGYELKITQNDKPIFDEQDIRRLCNTFTRRMWGGDAATPSIASRVDGTMIGKDTSLSVNGWIRLGAYDPTTFKMVKANYDARVFPQQKCTIGSYLQTVSEIVLLCPKTSSRG